jgi:chemotaxis protein histidine kinase CheA
MQDTTSAPAGLADFLQDASALLNRLNECHSHLEMIGNDPDAARGLCSALKTLAARAQGLGIAELASFSSQIYCLLDNAQARNRLHDTPLKTLSACLTHLAWQLELIDPRTGKLDLDCEEQTVLVEALAGTLETELPSASPLSNS